MLSYGPISRAVTLSAWQSYYRLIYAAVQYFSLSDSAHGLHEEFFKLHIVVITPTQQFNLEVGYHEKVYFVSFVKTWTFDRYN